MTTSSNVLRAIRGQLLLTLAVATTGVVVAEEDPAGASDVTPDQEREATPPGHFSMTIDRTERDPGEVEEEKKTKKERRGVTFGGFNKVIFEGKKEETLDIGREIKWEYTTTFQPRMFERECEAHLSISYAQMYDQVRVDTTIRQDGCPASSGEYRIRMRTRAEDGGVNNHEFRESWSREEPGTLEFRKDYPMGDDPDLIWARVQTSHASNCRCAVAVEEP